LSPIFPKNNQKNAVPRQVEMPFAVVQGQKLSVFPNDLYIPPDALEIILEAFEGPLDLLLYLIKRQNLDILDIDVSEITRQYTDYIRIMQDLKFELASDYLVMAAMLAEIKSQMLLPRVSEVIEEAMDPRAELIRRLQEYEVFKNAAKNIDKLTRLDRDIFIARAEFSGPDPVILRPTVTLQDLKKALESVDERSRLSKHHEISEEFISTRERMAEILSRLNKRTFVTFGSLFDPVEGKLGVIVTFLAVMELMKERLVDIVQTDSFGTIYVRAQEL
jgi:segregation and condensation protein A